MTDKIIEIGAVKLTKNKEVTIFDELVNPKIPIPSATTKIHGIKDEDVIFKRDISSVLPELLTFIDNLPIVAHNAKFDLGYIVFAVKQLGLPFEQIERSRVYCSCTMSRQVFKKDVANHKLGTLATHLQITLDHHHRALDDASAGLQLFARELATFQVDTHESMEKALKKGFVFHLLAFKSDIDLTLPNHLLMLREGCQTQTDIEIIYQGGTLSNQNRFRPVRPVSLLIMPNGRFLYAKCLLSDTYKSFSLKKIKEIRKK